MLYCKTNTETNLDCDPEELKSCTTDPCNLGDCVVYTTGSLNYCRSE